MYLYASRDRPDSVTRANRSRAAALIFTSIPSDHWRDEAACSNADPRLFDEGSYEIDGLARKDRREIALSICDSCPVIDACLDDADTRGDRGVIRGGVVIPLKTRRTT